MTSAFIRISNAHAARVSRHDATRKPYAVQRARKTGGKTAHAIRYAQVIADYRAATDDDARNDARLLARIYRDRKPRAYIQRPGRFFYCQHCGTRMTATATVYAKTTKTTEEPREICCMSCATARGYAVVTAQTWSHDAYARATHVQ